MLPITVATRFKSFFCGRSLAGIAVSNPVRRGYLSFVSVVCCQVEVSATGNNTLCNLIAEYGGGKLKHVACSDRYNTFVCLFV
jgi:hypothetical protein